MNLELDIGKDGDQYTVTAKSSLGTDTGKFTIDPVIHSEIQKIHTAIKEHTHLTENFVKELGKKLYKMLFSEIKDLFYACLDESDHITIIMTIKDPDISVLPWELCYDQKKDIFLGADSFCSLVRQDQKSQKSFEPIDYPLKVLVIVASPMDLDKKGEYQPDPEEIKQLMEPVKTLEKTGKIQLDFLDRASIKCIQDALTTGYHIVHFVGHGAYNADTKKGFLVIENKDRNSKNLGGPQAARLFGGNPPRLLILTACESAPLIPFLLSKKVPAVMAMQYTVLKDIAHEFVERFYSSLLKGYSVSQAVSQARLYVQLEEKMTHPGWFTPVVYTAGNILSVNTESQPQKVKEDEPRVDMTKDLLGAKHFVGRRPDIWGIEKALFEGRYTMVCITGIGGIGKSALADKFQKINKEKFEGVFAKKVVSNMGVEPILVAIDQFLMNNNEDRLHAVLGDPSLDLKLEVLNHCLQGKYLLVLDNFEVLLDNSLIRDKEIEKLVQSFLGGDHNSKVLITSRYDFKFRDKKGSGLTFFDLDELGFQFARLVLERNGITDFDIQERVFDKIGGNPQFLKIFAQVSRAKSSVKLLEDITLVKEEVGGWLLNELVGSLSEEEKEVVKAFSVYRHPVHEEGVMRGSDKVVQKVVDVKVVGVEKVNHDVYYYMHPLVREYCYDLLDDSEKIAAHSDAVNYYETKIKGKQVELLDFFELHYHLVKSEQYEKAGNLVLDIFEPLYMVGFRKELIGLLVDTIKTTEGNIKAGGFFDLGKILGALGELKEAEKYYTQSLDLAESLGDKQGIAQSLHQLGMLQEDQGNYKEAEKYYTQSLDLKESLGDKQGIAISLHQLGNLQYRQGNYKEAEKYYTQSLDLKESLGDKQGIARSLHQLGMLQEDQGNYKEAEKYYTQSLDLAESLGDKQGIARSLHQLGNLQEDQGNYKEAEKYYTQSLDLAESLGDKQGIAISLHQLGNLQYRQGNYKEAEKYYTQSLDLAESLGDKQGIARSLHQLGMLQYRQGNYKEAEKYYTQSLDLKESLGDKQGIARSLHQLGMLQEDQGNYKEAEKYYTQSLDLKESLGDKQGIARSLHQLGMLQEDQEEYETALKYYITSLILFSELHSPDAETAIKSLKRVRNTIGESEFDEYWKTITNQEVPDFSEPTYEEQIDDLVQNVLLTVDIGEYNTIERTKKTLKTLLKESNPDEKQLIQLLLDYINRKDISQKIKELKEPFKSIVQKYLE
jgi:tetratricopeptide (TPR) repeat protein